ncbi:AT-hook motif nuclear-localized protein 28-like protein [Tanacetum coccineum]|uniref:AT-hook motif nuclear-localized protein 28-like protein n=1 Tax=Tanacetum coccineum TaxID=301880 RepID=A0ABQ4XFE8_9ASTR
MADEESSSVQSVISNDDLLTEILVRLPALSLVLFKSVSKHWFSLIKQAANLTFRRNIDPPSGLFINKYTSYNKDEGSFNCEFVPLDIRIPLLATNNFSFCPEFQNECRAAVILDSCNGLLLCRTLSGKLYVCNPSISNMFKVLPQPDNVTWYPNNQFRDRLKMAFDPTKSSHYKLIYVESVVHDPHASNGIRVQIHTFSSETGNWSLCGHRFCQHCFITFKFGVYWNDAIYWSTGVEVFKLDIMNEHPVLTTLPTPRLTIDERLRPTNFLFESHGCLLLVGAHVVPSRHYTIYEKRNVYSEWSVKYTVNLDDIIPDMFSRHENIFCIVLGEREEDSFLVWQLGRKVVQHKIVSKTVNTISDLGPNDYLHGCFQFIPSFANV